MKLSWWQTLWFLNSGTFKCIKNPYVKWPKLMSWYLFPKWKLVVWCVGILMYLILIKIVATQHCHHLCSYCCKVISLHISLSLSLMDHSNQVKFRERGLLCPMGSFHVTCTICLLGTSSTNMACLLSRCCLMPITVGWQSLILFLRLSLQIELRNKLISQCSWQGCWYMPWHCCFHGCTHCWYCTRKVDKSVGRVAMLQIIILIKYLKSW